MKARTAAFKRRQALGATRARGLRGRTTKAEQALGEALQRAGLWFRYQPHFVADDRLYIPDFRLATHTYKLLIEVDGPSHQGRERYDAARTEWLMAKRNCRVLRFSNEEVVNNIERVMASILAHQPKRA